MMIRRSLLIGAVTVVAGAALTALPALPAMARPLVPAITNSPLGTDPVCDNETPYQVCLSANGTSGDFVYGKVLDSGSRQQHTTVSAALVRGGTDVVDGNGTNCPFKSGLGLNAKYGQRGDIIIDMHNSDENGVYYLGTNAGFEDIVQGASAGAGHEYVLDSAGGGFYYLINVSVSNTDGQAIFACSQGPNSFILLTGDFLRRGSLRVGHPVITPWAVSPGGVCCRHWRVRRPPGYGRVVVPPQDTAEALLVPAMEIIGARSGGTDQLAGRRRRWRGRSGCGSDGVRRRTDARSLGSAEGQLGVMRWACSARRWSDRSLAASARTQRGARRWSGRAAGDPGLSGRSPQHS
jgi:hypothetical protein